METKDKKIHHMQANVPSELMRRIKMYLALNDMRFKEFVVLAMQEKLEREETAEK